MNPPFAPESLSGLLRPFDEPWLELPAVKAYRQFYQLDAGAGVEWRLGCFSAAGYQIAAQLWTPAQPRATLILLHGYYDHAALYRHVVQWAVSLELAVLACDLPGHGLSSGARASIGDFGEYQQVLAGLLTQAQRLGLPAPWHLCGQSTGAAIVMDHLLHQPVDSALGQSILLAPLVRPRSWNWSKTSYRMLKPFVRQLPRRFTENSSDAEFIRFVHHHDPLQPQVLPTAWVGALARWVPRIERAGRSAHSPLVVQGEQDMTVDWRHNLKVIEAKFAAPQVLRLGQARHHLANETAALREEFFTFLRERLG